MTSCSKCVLDSTVPDIEYDHQGVCNYCDKHDKLTRFQEENPDENNLESITAKIKAAGKRKKYDCIVGISGGTDSIYTLRLAKNLGLRPLAVFFDNGWGTDIAVSNINNAVEKLGVDLYTYVVNWEEFKDIQKSFLKASVPCIEVPTDIGILGALYKLASDHGVKYILNGMSFKAEGTVPLDWSFIDGTYVKNVHKKFGSGKMKSYPLFTIYDMAYYTFIKKIKIVPMLNYVEYNKIDAKVILKKELDWVDYGGHHYENRYSAWAFGWYTLEKFGFDKRKVSLSGPIRIEKITKEKALEELSQAPVLPDKLTEFVVKKLELSEEEFDAIMKAKNKSFRDYKTSYNMLLRFKFLIKFLVNKKVLSPVVYYKYF